jgi:hypothetical protein
MTSSNVIRSIIAIGWVVNAILVERIVTRGGITDMSEIWTNGPVFTLVAACLVIAAVVLAIVAALKQGPWLTVSLVGGVAYALIGLCLRLNGDDSAAAIVLASVSITALSFVVGSGHTRPSAQR